MRKIFSESMLSTTLKTVEIPAGQYKGLILRYTGTNNNGQVGTKDNVGVCTPYLNSARQDSFTPARLWEINQRVRAGNVQRFSSTDNSTYEFIAYMPFGGWVAPNDGNVAHFGDKELKLEFSYTSPNTVFAALTLEIWAQYGLGVESYLPLPRDYNIRALSARAALQPNEGFQNLLAASVVYSANHTDILIQKGENVLYDMPVAAANLITNNEGNWQTYTAVAALVPYVINFCKDANLQAALHRDYRIGVISTDTSASGMIVRAMLRKDKTSLTGDLLQANRARRIAENPDVSGAV